MGAHSVIAWCTNTFNPWTGCTKVSPACNSCYAESWAKRTGIVQWGAHADRRRTSAAYWKQPLKWNRQAKESGETVRVFCASLADVFDNHVPDQWRTDLWDLIRDTPYLTWLLLTKRPQNIPKMLPPDWATGWRHVWLGTTVENNEEAQRRIPYLLRAPAIIHFLSMEPLLERVDFNDWVSRCPTCDGVGDCGREDCREGYVNRGIDWIIVGGESGHPARTMEVDWARDIREHCFAAHIPYFMKQGSQTPEWPDFKNVDSFPLDLQVREFPTRQEAV